MVYEAWVVLLQFSSLCFPTLHFERVGGSCDTCSLTMVFIKLGFWSPCDLQSQRKNILFLPLCRYKLIAVNKCSLMHMKYVISWPDFSFLLNVSSCTKY